MSAREAASALVLMTLLAAPAAASAEPGELERYPGPEIAESFETNFYRVHDAGLYFRLAAGLAYASSEIDPPARGESGGSESGARLTYQAVLGGFPVGRLALGAHQWGTLGGERGVVSAGPRPDAVLRRGRELLPERGRRRVDGLRRGARHRDLRSVGRLRRRRGGHRLVGLEPLDGGPELHGRRVAL